jgi:hypothetical protein
MNETPSLDLLLKVLRATATINLQADLIEITKYQSRSLDPPVELKVSEMSLERYIADAGEDAREAFGASTSPRRAAIQLLSVNLEEMILTRKAGQQTLVLKPDGLEWEV